MDVLKLINLDFSLDNTKAWLSKNGTNTTNALAWNNKDNIYYHSVAFTNDGYILTHGKAYNGSGIVPNLSGGLDGKLMLVYLSAPGITAYLAAPSANGLVLKYDTTKNELYWASDIDFNSTYKLAINSATANKGSISDTNAIDLGTIYAPTSNGTGIPSLSGTTWSWNGIVSDMSSNTAAGIPTVSAVKDYVTGGLNNITSTLTGAFQYKGVVTVDPTSKDWIEPTGDNAYSVGNVVSLGTKEFVKTDSGWKEFGDEGSFLLKDKKPLSSTTLSISDTTIETGITINLIAINPTNTKGSNNIVNGITTDTYGRVTNVSYTTAALTDTWKLNTKSVEGYVTAPGTTATNVFWGIGNTNTNPSWINLWTATNNIVGGIKLKNAPDSTDVTLENKRTHAVKLDKSGYAYVDIPSLADYIGSAIGSASKGVYWTGSAFVECSHSVLTDVPSNAVFTDTNTWRPIYAYTLATNSTLDSRLDNSTTSTNVLQFGSEFVWTEGDTNGANTSEIHLAWAEVDSNGNVTYAI